MTIAELHKIPLQAVPRDVFSLSGEAFVDAWATAFNLTTSELSHEERQNLVKAIRNGTNRLKIIDALRAVSRTRKANRMIARHSSSAGRPTSLP